MKSTHQNIKLEYLYRDGGNYKNWGEVIFSNPNQRPIEAIQRLIERTLVDSMFFYATEWKVPDLHFKEYLWDDETDHEWHQFHKVTLTNELASDNLESFLSRLRLLIN